MSVTAHLISNWLNNPPITQLLDTSAVSTNVLLKSATHFHKEQVYLPCDVNLKIRTVIPDIDAGAGFRGSSKTTRGYLLATLMRVGFDCGVASVATVPCSSVVESDLVSY